MQNLVDFFDSPVFYLILWIVCGVCFFIFKKNYKVDNSDIYENAEKVNQDKVGQFFLKKMRNQGNSGFLAGNEKLDPKDLDK